MGGLKAIEERNKVKGCHDLWRYCRSNGFYRGHAEKEARSRMNVTFNLENEAMEKDFVEKAKANDFIGVKGHRLVEPPGFALQCCHTGSRRSAGRFHERIRKSSWIN